MRAFLDFDDLELLKKHYEIHISKTRFYCLITLNCSLFCCAGTQFSQF